jgi:hypothetical protein
MIHPQLNKIFTGSGNKPLLNPWADNPDNRRVPGTDSRGVAGDGQAFLHGIRYPLYFNIAISGGPDLATVGFGYTSPILMISPPGTGYSGYPYQGPTDLSVFRANAGWVSCPAGPKWGNRVDPSSHHEWELHLSSGSTPGTSLLYVQYVQFAAFLHFATWEIEIDQRFPDQQALEGRTLALSATNIWTYDGGYHMVWADSTITVNQAH